MIQFQLVDTDRLPFEHALEFAQKQVRSLLETQPDYYPGYTKGGKWKHEGAAWTQWCEGFLPGMMWIFHRHLGRRSEEAQQWKELAIRYTLPLESRATDTSMHDLGFLFLSSYYRWYRLDRDPKLNDVLIQAGRTLAGRFQDKAQFLSSSVGDNSLTIDLMMNVGIVFYAAHETRDSALRDVAVRHCYTTRQHMVRGNGSTAQEGIFDLETGEFLRQTTQQGARGDSCWSRGLAWALYGFGSAYEYSRDPRFLDTAEACADFYITHAPSNGIPIWDFGAAPEDRTLLDTSAAAIAAAGFLRLCRLLHDPVKGHFYWSTAIRILQALCEHHLAQDDPEWEGILKGGVFHRRKNLGLNESVMWGEYFFVEALSHALRLL